MRTPIVAAALALALSTAGVAQTHMQAHHGQENRENLKIVNGPNVEGTGDTWAVIAWSTNTGGGSRIRYGTNPNDLNQDAEAPYDKDASGHNYAVHRVHLKDLRPDTTYYFRVVSIQGEGTGEVAQSPVREFRTKGRASGGGEHERAERLKIINGPNVEGTGRDWAQIAWSTNTGGGSRVHYGTDRNRLDMTKDSPYADQDKGTYEVHRVRLTGLRPNTTYYYYVDSIQGEGTGSEAKSGERSFKTK